MAANLLNRFICKKLIEQHEIVITNNFEMMFKSYLNKTISVVATNCVNHNLDSK